MEYAAVDSLDWGKPCKSLANFERHSWDVEDCIVLSFTCPKSECCSVRHLLFPHIMLPQREGSNLALHS